jgi:hypothetical protein
MVTGCCRHGLYVLVSKYSTSEMIKGGCGMEKLELDSTTASNRKDWAWTARNNARAADIKAVLEEMRPYWPLTERGLYYRLLPVNGPHWEWNGKPVDVYKALVRTLKWMRIDDIVPTQCIKDSHRILTAKQGYDDMGHFISDRLDFSFTQYNRCLAQDQPRHIEVWLEKAALLDLVEPVADEFCRRVMVCKGYNSITFQVNFYHRAKAAQKLGQVPTVLYFGDWDPSGVNMLFAAMQTIEDELGLDGVEYYRCGINPGHFSQLHKAPVPIKPSDSRSERFVAKHGTTAYELDAFHPEVLKSLVKDSIQHRTDMEILDANIAIEDRETENTFEMDDLLDDIKEKVRSLAEAR